MMRTTVNLPDDVYNVAQSLARMRGVSLGEAIAELVRRGLRPGPSLDESKPFPCFHLPSDSEPITLERTLEAEDEL
jgi:hypothetical protein